MPRRASGPSSGRKTAAPSQQPAQPPPQGSAPRPEVKSGVKAQTGGGGSSGFLASIGLAISFLAVFLLLPQRAFHGFGSDYYTWLVQVGDYGGLRQHVAFLPLVGLVFQAVHPLGFGAFHALLATAALGSAVGVFCLHRAGRLLLGSGPAATALAIGVALTPACFYFATAAEIHGVFAAGSGASWWAFARWRNAPQLARAAVLGSCCGLAGSIHSFGHLLMPMFAAIALTQDWLPRSHRIAHFSALAIAHLVIALALAFALGAGPAGQTSAAGQFVAIWRETTELGLAPATLWREAIVPFLPWSLIALLGMLRAGSRPWSSAFVIGTALHAPIVILLLSRPGSQFHEQGGYLLPMAVPAVLAAIAVMPRPVFWLTTLVSASLTAALVVPRWPRVYEPAFVAAVEQLRSERSFALLVGPHELEGVRTHVEGLVCLEVNRTLDGYFGLMRASPQPVPLPEYFDAGIDKLVKKGDPLLVTAEARKCFEDSTDESVRNLWREHVQRNYVIEPLQRPGLEGVLIRHR